MPPQIVVEDASSMNNIYTPESASVNSWKSTTTIRVTDYDKGRAQHNMRKESKGTLKRWWSNTTQQASPGSPNWKPLSMTTPILGAVIVASLLMVAAIELLAQKSQRQGGLALSPSLKEIPQYALISSQYIPQILAVCYSLIWSWIDLDVKRMQPWFEMSKPEGALAGDSLLLDYPFTFMAFVPFKAAQRRHWLVFLSGTSLMLVFWAITPLQSGQLGTDRVKHSTSLPVYQRSSLVPIEEQEGLMGIDIINTAYAVAWLDQPSPGFTTPNAAYLPFYVNDTMTPTSLTKTNYTADTWRLYTDLDCRPAEISLTGGQDKNMMSFLDGQNCNNSIRLPSDEISMYYIGYYKSTQTSFAMERQLEGNCPRTENSTHQFLATWADVKGHYLDPEPIQFNVTGAYCRPKYFKQEVRITVDAVTLQPDETSLETLSPPENLSPSEFNVTAFEFLLAHGIDQAANNDGNMDDYDFPGTSINEQSLRFTERNVSQPSTNMIAFALSQDKRSIREFSDMEAYHEALLKAQQFLFSFTVSQILQNHTTGAEATEATSTAFLSGIVADRVISSVLEALILVFAIFSGIMLWLCRSMTTNLDKNPSSIERLAAICQNDPRILDAFCSVSHSDDDRLAKAISQDRLRLIWDDNEGRPKLDLEANVPEKGRDMLKSDNYYYEPVKPEALRWQSGVSFIVAIFGIIGGLIYLKWAEVQFNGLKRPSPNQTVQGILENYIPTMLSTLIEPFWVLVNRLLCVLRPFQELWDGKAQSDRSISVTYTSVPPQFAAWRALKSRHFVLFLVCSTVFLANILTISLPAVFQDEEVTSKYTQAFVPSRSQQFNNESVFSFYDRVMGARTQSGSYNEEKYAMLAHETVGADLPPWVSEQYFFQPWDVSEEGRQQEADSYVIITRGYGAKMNCTPVDSFELPFEKTLQPVSPGEGNCGDPVAIAGTELRGKVKSDQTGTGPFAAEALSTVGSSADHYCRKTLTLAWGRTEDASAPDNSTVQASMVVCNPVFQTAMFEVHVDLDGRIKSHKNITAINAEMDHPDFERQAAQLIANANEWHVFSARGWHNSTLTNDWINHFLMLEMDSRKHLDPAEPVPDPKELMPHLDTIYRMLFALLLGLEHKYLFEAPPPDRSEGERHTIETRLFLDQAAFITSMTMLAFNIIVAAVLYFCGTVFVLPRMPTTLGSLITYIAPSRMMEDVSFQGGILQERTFSFGRFIGRDGRAHVGIDADPNVVRIEPNSVRKQKRQSTYAKHGEGSPVMVLKAQTWL